MSNLIKFSGNVNAVFDTLVFNITIVKLVKGRHATFTVICITIFDNFDNLKKSKTFVQNDNNSNAFVNQNGRALPLGKTKST